MQSLQLSSPTETDHFLKIFIFFQDARAASCLALGRVLVVDWRFLQSWFILLLCNLRTTRCFSFASRSALILTTLVNVHFSDSNLLPTTPRCVDILWRYLQRLLCTIRFAAICYTAGLIHFQRFFVILIRLDFAICKAEAFGEVCVDLIIWLTLFVAHNAKILFKF